MIERVDVVVLDSSGHRFNAKNRDSVEESGMVMPYVPCERLQRRLRSKTNCNRTAEENAWG